MNTFMRRWSMICLFNLLLVALMGCLMRYKIIFPLRIIDQKNILHAHSHFAFAGWITQALFCFLVDYLYKHGITNAHKKYRPLLLSNLLTAYGMLFTFPFGGYKLPSIIFSTLSIFVSYWFTIQYWKDLKSLPEKEPIVINWLKAALSFMCLSSVGAFSLAFIIATHQASTPFYLLSVYFFLHFQYNGWFTFACMGLLASLLFKNGANNQLLKKIYWLFLAACIPAYFLSALWLHIGTSLYTLVIIAVLFQLAGWIMTVAVSRTILHKIVQQKALAHFVLVLVLIAMSTKLLLQAGSAIPSLSKLAFSLRPIVIGYLHLILLGIISLFLFFYLLQTDTIRLNKTFKTGLLTFIAGILLNEILLMIQGIADIQLTPQPGINTWLFYISFILGAGVLVMNISQWIFKNDSTHK